MISINSIKTTQTQYINVDFGWYYQIDDEPVRASSYTYTDGESEYPPGATSLVSVTTLIHGGRSPNVTITANPITLYNNMGNEAYSDFYLGSGTLFLLQGDNWALVQYSSATAGTPGTFDGCVAYAGTQTNLSDYTSGATIYDPRFFIPAVPLNTLITFDALDSQNLGLATTDSLGIYPVQWIWDVGTGQNHYGPQVQVAYNFNVPPPTVQVSLTVTDNNGNQHVGQHHIIIVPS